MSQLDKNRIEDVKNKLYDPTEVTNPHYKEGTLHPLSHKVSNSWASNEVTSTENMDNLIKNPPMSIFKKFFIGAVLFFFCAIGFAAYNFLTGSSSVNNDKIDILVLGNAFTKGGDELPLQIEVVNHNNVALELASLIISYPKGASDNINDVVYLPRIDIGTIASGESKTFNITVALFGEEKSVRDVHVALEYHPGDSNAIFTKEQVYPVTISASPISILIDAPDSVTSDQSFDLTITSILNTNMPNESTYLQLSYPAGFVYESATITPIIGNNIWDISNLTSSKASSIVVSGRIVASLGEDKVFHAYVGTANASNKSKIEVVYNSLLHNITVTKPFLEARIAIGSFDSDKYAVYSGQEVVTDVSYTNNLPNTVTDAVVILNLSGNAFDKTKVNPKEGFYDSLNNRIVWDKTSIKELESIESGKGGKLSFSFTPVSFSGSSNILRSPQVVLDVSISGREPTLGGAYNEVKNFSKKIVKIISNFQIVSSLSYASGQFPPKADVNTNYKMTWTLSNTVNSITDAEARAVLPTYVTWVGNSSDPSSKENLTYNEVSREVIWHIGSVRANTGFDSNREASFTLSMRPSLSQVGTIPQIIKDFTLSGQDSFTGVLIKTRKGNVNAMINEGEKALEPGKVIQ